MGKVTAPSLLSDKHRLSQFDCDNDTLNRWLHKQALKNQYQGASRTFVICASDKKTVIGYYALATGSVERSIAPGGISRNMPDPVPVIVLGRLAVDKDYQGQKLGAGLLKDAIGRALSISHHVGVRALLVHAIDESAKSFYISYGFKESPFDSMVLMLKISDFKN